MNETRLSLLRRLQDGSDCAWQELIELYTPLVRGWLERHGVAHHDAEELSQDVMTTVFRKMSDFSHSGRTGAFRSWLRVITVNRANEFWRAGKRRPVAAGGNAILEAVHQLGDEQSELSKAWDEEHDRYLLRVLFRMVSSEFEEATLDAFHRTVVGGEAPSKVASELGMTVGAVYSAKSRVLRRLRQEAMGIVDDSCFA